MPIALTCDCGARFELDGALAGWTIVCPECLQPMEALLHVPADTPPRTSMLALLSIVIALAGAFTVVGSMCAAILGIVALVQLRWRRGRLEGGGLACCGIVLGLTFTCVTVGLLWSDCVPIAAWMRQRTTAAPVDTTGALEVLSRDANVILRRPSKAWGRVQDDRSDDPDVSDLQEKRELLLANVREHAFIDVARFGGMVHLSDMDTPLAKDLQPPRPPLLGSDDEAAEHGPRPVNYVQRPRDVPSIGRWEGRECVVDLPRGGQTWRMLIRIYKKPDATAKEPAYLFRAYAPKRRFDTLRQELEDALNSVQLPR